MTTAAAAASSMARRGKVMIERISARVFCHMDEQGGNPVTIFSSNQPLKPATQQKLAQDCHWESVMIHYQQQKNDETSQQTLQQQHLPKLSFYMPSGEQVSFCAHAAMGAALEVCSQSQDDTIDEVSFTVANILSQENDAQSQRQQQHKEKEYHTTIYDGDIVALNMKASYHQTKISQPPMLYRMLRDYCHLGTGDLASTPSNDPHDTTDIYNYITCHASIARPKTLIPLRSIQDLHEKALAPPQGNQSFALCCKALDDTTGLYLYAKSEEEDGAWECRQFPRSSGYSEDPATGIAAAALACHLYQEHEIELPAYKMYQGGAMGKPSLIVVDELEMTEPLVAAAAAAAANDEKNDMNSSSLTMEASFRLLGRVEIDDRDKMEIMEEHEES